MYIDLERTYKKTTVYMNLISHISFCCEQSNTKLYQQKTLKPIHSETAADVSLLIELTCLCICTSGQTPTHE